MNELELKQLWQTTSEKLEKTIAVNRINSEEISRLKIYHFISLMKPIKIFTLLAGIVWVGAGLIILSNLYLNSFSEMSKFFLFSASVQVGLTGLALFMYLYQLFTIYQVDITEPILRAQKKIASLKTSTLWVTRILCLQLPFWTTFWWTEMMLQEWNVLQWLLTAGITLAFSFAAIWLFLNIKSKNSDKKWFRLIFNGMEWAPLINAMALLDQLDEYNADIEPETRVRL